MSEIIPFPARPLRVVGDGVELSATSHGADEQASTNMIRSFVIAMGASIDPLKILGYIHERQGKLLERWVDESVEHLGHDIVIEMLESMTLHLMQEKRK